MEKRKRRKATEGVDFMKPIDITKFGTEEDPCFGKLYNLSAEECRRCGDSELCAVKFSQNMKTTRAEQKGKTRFKDEELGEINESLVKWVREKKVEGYKRAEIIKMAKRTFGSTREEIKNIYKNA